jgi:hypothetical protein
MKAVHPKRAWKRWLLAASRLPLEIAAAIERLRRQRLTGPQIARKPGRPVATVGLVLRRLGLGRPPSSSRGRRSCATGASGRAS